MSYRGSAPTLTPTPASALTATLDPYYVKHNVNQGLANTDTLIGRQNILGGSLESVADLGLITNPFFEFSQELGTTGVIGVASPSYILDQWITNNASGSAVLNAAQIANPSIFAATSGLKTLINGHRVTVTTSQASYTSGQYVEALTQPIEGYFIRGLGLGTTDSKSVDVITIISVSVAGTYCIAVRGASVTRSYVTTVSLSANTPTLIFFTVPPETSGAWTYTNTAGMYLTIGAIGGTTYQAPSLNSWQTGNYVTHSSATNWVGTNGATIDVAYANIFPTGVLPFTSASQIIGEALQRLLSIRRPFNQELIRCMRYYQTFYIRFDGQTVNGGNAKAFVTLLTPTRVAGTATAALAYNGFSGTGYFFEVDTTSVSMTMQSTATGQAYFNNIIKLTARM